MNHHRILQVENWWYFFFIFVQNARLFCKLSIGDIFCFHIHTEFYQDLTKNPIHWTSAVALEVIMVTTFTCDEKKALWQP